MPEPRTSLSFLGARFGEVLQVGSSQHTFTANHFSAKSPLVGLSPSSAGFRTICLSHSTQESLTLKLETEGWTKGRGTEA